LIRAFHRRRHIALLTLITFLIAGGLACLFFPKSYKSTGMIRAAREGGDALGLGSMLRGTGSAAPDDALSSAITLETQADILRSDSLALRVIKELQLENNADFKPKFNPIDMVLSFLSPSSAADPQGAKELEEQPAKRTHLLRVFSKHLKIALVPGSQLINVSYTNSDPKTSAAVVNSLMKALSEQDGQARRQQAEQSSAWVNDQMTGLRDQTDALQKQLAEIQKNSGIYAMGTLDANGHPQEYSEVLEHLQLLTGQLMQAEQGRILKGAVYMAAQSGNGEILSGLVGNSAGNGLSESAANSLSLIQSLRGEEATLESQIHQDEVKFGPAYPKIAEEKGSLTSIQGAIRDESARLADRARSDFEIAQSTENSIRQQYNTEKAKANALNDKAVQYMITRQEADDTRSLYDDLLKRLKEAGIAAGLGTTSFTVVDRGLVPSLPKWPNIPVFLALATLGGVFLGSLLAVIIDLLDGHVKDVEELEGHGNLIGLVPSYALAHDSGRYWKALQSSDSRFLDAVQMVSFCIANAHGEPPRTVVICSALPREGKTVLSIGLASYYAQQGLNVLLVETNTKVPKLATFTSLPTADLALSTESDTLVDEYTKAPAVPNLSIIPANRLNGHGVQQPSLVHMREQINLWRKRFDVVVIDGPAVLHSQGWLSICSVTNHLIYVARHRKTTLSAANRTVSMLSRLQDIPMSLVMTDVNERSSEFKNYYGIYSARQLTKGLKYEQA
jgi:uncharacterized protein involved in exopolysaccharide biosynthesis/Mrp family chromosome partitioning ATPase